MIRNIVLRTLAAASVIGVAGCLYPYTPNDAGDGAWVEQVVPAVLGRKPVNAMESRVLVDLMHQKGREAVVDVLMARPDFEEYWAVVLADMLKLQRDGLMPQANLADSASMACWNTPTLYTSFAGAQGGLAGTLSSQIDPTLTVTLPNNFSMADVLRSAIARDDLFTPFRAQLLSLGKSGRSHSSEAQTAFLRGFVNRQSDCVSCHTSTWSRVDIAPVPLDLDGALFPNGSVSADRVGTAFGEGGGTTIAPFGHMSAGCADILQGSVADAYTPQNEGSDFAGLHPSDDAHYDVLDLDRALLAGRNALTATDLSIDLSQRQDAGRSFSFGSLSGEKSFAAALALSATEAVVKALEGHGLTLPHGHPRVDEQRYYLQGYASSLVFMNWSLRYLIKSLVLRGTFNMVAPSEAPSAYPFPMFFNGWAKNDVGAGQNVNGQGDLVHRYNIPALLSAAHHALGWPTPKVAPGSGATGVIDTFMSKELARDLGRYESLARPGKDDVDFQSLLTWEAAVGTCRKPISYTSPYYRDWVEEVLLAINNAPQPGYTVRDVIVAFKDRLIQDQTIAENPGPETPSTFPGPKNGYDPSWDDTGSILERLEQESQMFDVRAQQREAARVRAVKLVPPDGSGASEPPEEEDPDAWRERFDAFADKLADKAWKQKWQAYRDTVTHEAAVKMLDQYGVQKGYWKIQLPDTEADFLADYFGVSSLGFPAALVYDLPSKLRGYCGTLLTSPQFMLGGIRPAQSAADPIPSLLVCIDAALPPSTTPTNPFVAQSRFCNEHQLCQDYANLADALGYGGVVCP
ncbi:Hypothetical protein A7982_08458 [Minicystis rosea]|nr:Hypothetical protein A7982_08458 [Minicystis rosea]